VSTVAHREIYYPVEKNKIRREDMYHLRLVPVVPLLEDEISIHYSGL
jgi:hypothetical protein